MAQSSSSSSISCAATGKYSSSNQKRGVGYGARFNVAEGDLPPGWRCERRGPKYTVWYDNQGKVYRSSKEVEQALMTERLLGDPAPSETDTETGGETSEYEASPVKLPRLQNV